MSKSIFHLNRKIRESLEELVLLKSFYVGVADSLNRFCYVSIKYGFDCSVEQQHQNRTNTEITANITWEGKKEWKKCILYIIWQQE